MADLVRQTLDWIEAAPLKIRGTSVASASPEAVFAVLANHEAWPQWFPGLKRVDVLGPAAGVGARRRVKLPMTTVDEEFIAWEPGVRFAFTGTAASPRFTSSLVEDCRLEPTADGGTAIGYTMYLAPAGPAGFLIKAAAGRVRSNLQAGVDALATLAAKA